MRSEKSGPLRIIEEGGHMELALRFSTGLPQQPDQDTPCYSPAHSPDHGKAHVKAHGLFHGIEHGNAHR